VTDPQDDSTSQAQQPADSDDAVEPGAIIRSPAPAGIDESADPHVRWPWEVGPNGEHAASKTRIPPGPTIRTEKLYRSSGYADPTIGEDPLAATPSPPLSGADGDSVPPQVDSPKLGDNPEDDATAQATPRHQARVERMDDMATAAPTAFAGEPQSPSVAEKGLSTVPVFLIIFGVTTVVGLADMYLNRQFTYLTGGAFVIASAIGAMLVRPRDLWTAVISPPIAFLIALIVAGQPTTITGTGQLLLREASLIGTGLAFNAPYVFGGTILALVIVLVRRVNLRRS
jgi:hypothetical protein